MKNERRLIMMSRVLLTEKFDNALDIKALEKLYEYADIRTASNTTEATLAEEIKDVDALIVRLAPITRKIINSANRLKVICRTGIGFDMVDIEAATEKGILVCNVPGQHRYAVAEHALALILALAKNLIKSDKQLRVKGWSSRADIWPSCLELKGKVLGVIGLGESGFEIAIRGSAFGMSIFAYDPYISPKKAESIGVKLVDLDDLIKKSDFISIHCPLNKETHHLIDNHRLNLMKSSAFLINCARGPIVDNEALIKSLSSGEIAGAGLDVFEEEPLELDNPLLKMDNVILTAHIAGMAKEVRKRVMGIVVENTLRVLRGETPSYIVNPSAKSSNP